MSRWIRRQRRLLARSRRAQLFLAVLVGALIGGGFVAASTAPGHDGGPQFPSVSDHWGPGPGPMHGGPMHGFGPDGRHG